MSKGMTALLVLVIDTLLCIPCLALPSPSGQFPQFKQIPSKFRFAIVADPQVGHQEDKSFIQTNAKRTLKESTLEMNAMDPMPGFAVYLGDLCNVFDERSTATFEDGIKGMKPQVVLVHGNHDGRVPYIAFRELMKRQCGFDEVYYSFDAGDWHFMVIPCNLAGNDPEVVAMKQDMLAWMREDLEANKDRPTIVFEHLHLMPQGQTQLEWYTFSLPMRLALMDEMAKHGNVKYYFNGHVHNGIQAAVKTAWTYKGITFITAPTIIGSRSFGEEYPEFERGLLEGGYYLVCDVDGKDLTIKGRLCGESKEYVFPKEFRPFEERIEPRWFSRLVDLPSVPALVNGDFSQGVEGWIPTYRYQTDTDPNYVWEKVEKDGVSALYLKTKTKLPLYWMRDEYTELYQIIDLPQGGAPILTARYVLEKKPEEGGGYLRVLALKDSEFKAMFMFRWGDNEKATHHTPNAFQYAITGDQSSPNFLQTLAANKQGFYWNLPDSAGGWHDLKADLQVLHDQATGKAGMFSELGINRFVVALGTWVNYKENCSSSAWFTGINLSAGDPLPVSTVDGTSLPVDESVFSVAFGKEQMEKGARNENRDRHRDRPQTK